MKNLYQVDRHIAANLAFELSLREEQMLAEQLNFVARSFKQRIKNLDREELTYITYLILDAYSKQQGKNYYFESLLDVIEQQLKACQ